MDKNFELIITPHQIVQGGKINVRFIERSERTAAQASDYRVRLKPESQLSIPDAEIETQNGAIIFSWELDTKALATGGYFLDICNQVAPNTVSAIECTIVASSQFEVFIAMDGLYMATSKIANKDDIGVSLKPTDRERTPDLALWVSILQSTQTMSFENYSNFMDLIFCGPKENELLSGIGKDKLKKIASKRFLPFSDTDSYRALKAATEAFVMTNCGVALGEFLFDEAKAEQEIKLRKINLKEKEEDTSLPNLWKNYLKGVNGSATIPYLYLVRDKLKDIPLKKHTLDQMLELTVASEQGQVPLDEGTCFGIISEKLSMPCFLELIWSYWHEESMMVQAMNAISRRFQNVRNPRGNDPLAGIEINPLQPLNNLLWGYIQDEQHRLSVVRRSYEYDHHYGISLQGKVIKNFSPADSRSRFLEAFHQLLYICAQYYKQEDDLTIQADPFPIRNALREVHLILSEGAHNQYGDLPSTARIEMLMQQYILARPEFRQVLPTRVMVAYPEPWMDRVNAINHLMGWTKSSPIHFANLGIFGEQLLLSIRFGGWSISDTKAEQAGVWANFWRQAVQEYIHAYYSVTGVDLSATRVNNVRVDSLQPAFHLANRAKENGNGKSQGIPSSNGKSTVGY